MRKTGSLASQTRLNVKEPRGRLPHQMARLCRKHRSTSDGVKAPSTNACHTCLTTNLGIGFWNRMNPRLVDHHRRRSVLRWRHETVSSRSGVMLRGEGAVYVGPTESGIDVGIGGGRLYGALDRELSDGVLVRGIS